ncbi:hypothetical protein F4604DRAFT_116074 [Suillus subluteus]|nr:hypothetical protein F4604DRAFT_116074 [Suillus subluteus]
MFYSSSISCSCPLSNVASEHRPSKPKCFFSRLTTRIQNCESCAFVWCLHPRTVLSLFSVSSFVIDWSQLFISPFASLANEVFHLLLFSFSPSLIVVCVYILGRCAVSH